MKIRAMILVLVSLVPSSAVYAISQASFMAETVYVSGTNHYEISFGSGKSRLDWDMDMYLKGLSFNLALTPGMDINLSCLASPWQSGGHFLYDTDWDRDGAITCFSSSHIDNKAIILRAGAGIYPLRAGRASLRLYGGYEAQRFHYRGYDTTQYEYEDGLDAVYFVGGSVITYRLDYDLLYVGLGLGMTIPDRVEMGLNASVIPYALARDRDNHLRRNKVSTGRCTGTGMMMDAFLRIKIIGALYGHVECGIHRIRTSGSQSQRWYGDDPVSRGIDDTGYVFSNIPQECEQSASHMGIGMGFSF